MRSFLNPFPVRSVAPHVPGLALFAAALLIALSGGLASSFWSPAWPAWALVVFGGGLSLFAGGVTAEREKMAKKNGPGLQLKS